MPPISPANIKNKNFVRNIRQDGFKQKQKEAVDQKCQEDEEAKRNRREYISRQQQAIAKIKHQPARYNTCILIESDVVFEVQQRYQVKKVIGAGAYGTVCSGLDTLTNQPVAIKQMRNIFQNNSIAKRTLRELKFLRYFSHENIMNLSHVMWPNCNEANSIYMVSELMDTDLTTVIQSQQRVVDGHCQYFVYQILRGLKYIHSVGVIHRDLKPRNLLVDSNCELKICDFGLTRNEVTDDCSTVMSDYIATRWYRAPEVVLCREKYTQAIDIWAVGCIFAELLNRKPLFPGRDSFHQIFLIVSTMGTSNLEVSDFLDALPKKSAIPFNKVVPNATPLACDFLSKLMTFDPSLRMTATEALQHPYLQDLHYEEDEPICDTLNKDDFYFENLQTTKEDLHVLLQHEVLCNYPQEKDQKESMNVKQKSLKFIGRTHQRKQRLQRERRKSI